MTKFASLIFIIICFSSCLQKQADLSPLVLIKGGIFKNKSSNYYGKDIHIKDFYIGRYEVTQKEWFEIMNNNPSEFKGEDLPVERVSWYDCLEYCNKKSAKEGFELYYNLEELEPDSAKRKNIDAIDWVVSINKNANGYRLPSEMEWEYAASGGQKSSHYLYSGSGNLDDTGWYWQNSGDEFLSGVWDWSKIEKNNNQTKAVGRKQANELKLYDMSGNVREWCWDVYIKSNSMNKASRVLKGGGWFGGDFTCEIIFRGYYRANGIGSDTGFRVCRNK